MGNTYVTAVVSCSTVRVARKSPGSALTSARMTKRDNRLIRRCAILRTMPDAIGDPLHALPRSHKMAPVVEPLWDTLNTRGWANGGENQLYTRPYDTARGTSMPRASPPRWLVRSVCTVAGRWLIDLVECARPFPAPTQNSANLPTLTTPFGAGFHSRSGIGWLVHR